MTDLLNTIKTLLAERDALAARVRDLEEEKAQICALLNTDHTAAPKPSTPKTKRKTQATPTIPQTEQATTILLDAARSGDPWVTSKTLRDALGISAGSFCTVISRLKERGQILIKPDPTHGRRKLYAHASVTEPPEPPQPTEDEQNILSALNGKPLPLRDLYRVTQIPVATLESALKTLKTRGVVTHTKHGWIRT